LSLFQPTAIVLPHHNLVATTRQELLQQISKKRPITNKIILIGPDHFSANQNQITISDQSWNLSTGEIKFADLNLDLPVNNNLVKNDHAIFNPLTDLKTYFPNASVYPAIIGQKVSQESLDSLLSKITQVCHSDCLLVASVDFSHYLPATLAQVHDAYTIDKLQNLNHLSILNAEVDSPQSLYLLTKFSQSKKFTLYSHTNSGFINGNPDYETTTHIFGYYSPGFRQKSYVMTSVHTPYPLDRDQNQTTLGDRFFYGSNFFLDNSTLPNFVIGQIETPEFVSKSFLPIKENKLIIGAEKKKLITDFFDTIPNGPNLTKDYFWGKLIYERK